MPSTGICAGGRITDQNSPAATLNTDSTLQVFGHNTDDAIYTAALDPATFTGPNRWTKL